MLQGSGSPENIYPCIFIHLIRGSMPTKSIKEDGYNRAEITFGSKAKKPQKPVNETVIFQLTFASSIL